MIRYIRFILIVVLFQSCNNNIINKPDNLISEAEMVDIIVDLTLLNSAPGIDKSILEKKEIEPESYVYEKYAIDSIQFVASNNYYAHNIDAYQDIYANVKLKLNNKKEEYKLLNEKELKEKKKKDSIRTAEKRRDKSTIIKENKLRELKKIKTPLKSIDSLLQ